MVVCVCAYVIRIILSTKWALFERLSNDPNNGNERERECPAEINDTLPLSHSIQTVTGKHSDKGTVSSFVCSESTLFILFNA